jgi:hypothetical protein
MGQAWPTLGGEERGHAGQKEKRGRGEILFFFLNPFSNPFSKQFEFILDFDQTTQPKEMKCIGMYDQTCFYLIINFNLMKNYYFPMFS